MVTIWYLPVKSDPRFVILEVELSQIIYCFLNKYREALRFVLGHATKIFDSCPRTKFKKKMRKPIFFERGFLENLSRKWDLWGMIKNKFNFALNIFSNEKLNLFDLCPKGFFAK